MVRRSAFAGIRGANMWDVDASMRVTMMPAGASPWVPCWKHWGPSALARVTMVRPDTFAIGSAVEKLRLQACPLKVAMMRSETFVGLHCGNTRDPGAPRFHAECVPNNPPKRIEDREVGAARFSTPSLIERTSPAKDFTPLSTEPCDAWLLGGDVLNLI